MFSFRNMPTPPQLRDKLRPYMHWMDMYYYFVALNDMGISFPFHDIHPEVLGHVLFIHKCIKTEENMAMKKRRDELEKQRDLKRGYRKR